MSDNSQRNNILDGIRLTHTTYVILKLQQQKAFFFLPYGMGTVWNV